MLKWIGSGIVLGLISATLSYYNKNYYVGVFNDILGKDEDERVVTRVGRGFLYGFFFPLYLTLLVVGLIFLLIFLIVAGIVAAIVFALVWVTENLLPHDWFGDLLLKLYGKIGMTQPAPRPAPPQPSESPVTPQPGPPPGSPSPYVPPAADALSTGTEEPKDKPEDPGINVTRTHKLD